MPRRFLLVPIALVAAAFFSSCQQTATPSAAPLPELALTPSAIRSGPASRSASPSRWFHFYAIVCHIMANSAPG